MKNYKKILSAVLALALAVPGISIPADVQAAEANLALYGTTTASSYEDGTSFTGDKATDGNLSTRWGTGEDEGAGAWLQVDLGAECTINSMVINFERTDDAQNILGYHVEIDGETVYSKDTKAAQVETITFAEAETGQVVKLVIDSADGGTLNYVNVGINEFQIFGENPNGTPEEPEQGTLVNLALGKNATSDSNEASSLTAAKATDGDTESRSSRWASAVASGAHWIYVDLGAEEEFQTVRVIWETRKPTAYRIQTSNDASDWTDVKVFTDRPSDTDDVIVLDEAVTARYVRLYIDSFTSADPDGSGSWNNVSIYEMEIYNGIYVKPVAPIDMITVETPEKGDTKLVVNIPESDDYTITYNGTDYEQVIDEDLTIYEPIVDTTVKVSFKAVNNADENDYEFKEVEVTVPGKYTQEEGDNEAPAIIPELTEWKGYTGNFTVAKNAKVVIESDELLAQAEAFAADYEDLSGKTMEIAVGTLDDVKEGEFYLALTDDTSLGLMEEGYIMEITDYVTVEAQTATGAYWATRTILQALKSNDMTTIPQGITRDYPLYEVRGIILDVGRKTFTMDFLQQVVKQMSWYKLNDFHVHLNDNYIFLENYTNTGRDPMTAYSGFRLESDIKAGDTVTLNGKEFTYQADLTNTDVFYTKDEFRSFIQESDVLGVNIVPEFDAPAHSLSFTKVLPELRTGTSGRQNDHLDLATQYDECYDFITNIFDEYLLGDDPVFSQDTVVHIGADEYTAAPNKFREFCNDMADYVESTGRTARIWGSLTTIKGDGSVEVDGTGIQMNLWNFGYANMDEMYESGFDLINCDDGTYYIVPNAGYYADYLGTYAMYESPVNTISNVTIPAGDKQMLGAAYAIWNDMMDERDNGISEYDIYKRISNNMGLFAAKLWGKGDMDTKEAQTVSAVMGDAPNTDFGYETEADKKGNILNWSSEDLTEMEGKNVNFQEDDGQEVVVLNGGESYLETGLETLGLGTELTVKVKRTSDSTEDQILFESAYGAIKAVQGSTGKVGISRENYDYSFDYELPVDEWVELTFKNEFETVHLYVNGELVDTIGDGETVMNRPLVATCMFPVAKIGSETNAFVGYVATVAAKKEIEVVRTYYDSAKISVTASSEETVGDDAPAAYVVDGDESTFWHSQWKGTDGVAAVGPHWIQLEMEEVQKINGLYYLPRTDSANGRILGYTIEVSTDGENYTTVVENGTWADNSNAKVAEFDAIEAKYVRLTVNDSQGGFATAAEFKISLAEQNEVVRIAGAGRIDTALAVADTLKETLGVDKFETVIIATSKTFADALPGSYLAYVENAPILLTSDARMDDVVAYVKANLVDGGKVYILGGEAAVSASLEGKLAGYDVDRLAGSGRYETNMMILDRAGVTGGEIIVATGKSFADSLSASAAKLPILMVKDSLNADQKALLAAMNVEKFYIVGGESAVSAKVADELAAYASVERVAGANRRETSIAVAKKFFTNPDMAVVASASNFPDGLCGGALAAALDAPLVLTVDGKTSEAAAYTAELGIEAGYVLGGTGVLTDDSVVTVFSLESADDIIVK